MPYDFKSWLNVSKAEETHLLRDLQEAEWARYGRNVHALMMSERFVKAVSVLILADQLVETPSVYIARRLRAFLTTGVIAK